MAAARVPCDYHPLWPVQVAETFHPWEFPSPRTSPDHIFTHLTLHLWLWPLEWKRTPDPSSLFMSWIPGTVNESLHVVATEEIHTQDLKGSYPMSIGGAGHQQRETCTKKQRWGERGLPGFLPFFQFLVTSPSLQRPLALGQHEPPKYLSYNDSFLLKLVTCNT